MPAAPSPSQSSALLLMGRILKAHGVRGEVKVIPETDDPTRFEALETVYLGPGPDDVRAFALEGVRYQTTAKGPLVMVRLRGIDDRDQADALRRLKVYADEADLPPLGEDEVYLHDLVGLDVVTEGGVEVGQIREVLELPAQPVYVVARPGRPDVMVPAVEAFVAAIEMEARRVVIRPIEGLLD